MRGSLSRILHDSPSNLHFRGRSGAVLGERHLRLGRNVVFGRNVSMSCQGGVELGDRVTVGDFSNIMATTVIREPGLGLTVGEYTSIGRGNVLWAQGGISIGRDCLLGPNVTIISENHNITDTRVPIRLQGNTRSSIVIEDDCWIGANVTILAGVSIGRGSVVGAGSVVTRSVEANSIALGSPARVVSSR
ncbi:acyltransferase [Pseudarthrobacter sp. J64]|uniref:acyltransferase n=1 Tax=Pseudarthrobacter sp. J64 TaxID=3116485 RepID=UPI003FA6E498